MSYKLNPKIFRNAAEALVDDFRECGVGCCGMLREVSPSLVTGTLCQHFMVDLFYKYDAFQRGLYWWRGFGEKAQLARSIALLLCAELIEDARKK